MSAVRRWTTGPPTRASSIIGRATHDAIASGLLRPIRFGTSSPMISDSTVIPPTTSASAMPSAYGASCGTSAIGTASFAAIVAPP